MTPPTTPRRFDPGVSPYPARPTRTIFDEYRETRFAGGLFCPRCKGQRPQRWGRFSGRQRYRCRDCGRTFSDLTATPLERTRYPLLWPRFCALLLKGVSVRDCGRQLGIDKDTAWRWRHRILTDLRIMDPPAMRDIVELHETTFAHSEKGSRRLRDAYGLPRPPRRRGAGRGLRHRRAWVLLLQGRSTTCRAEYVGERRPNARRLLELLDEGAVREVRGVLCPWGPLSAYGRFCRARGIPFVHVSRTVSVIDFRRLRVPVRETKDGEIAQDDGSCVTAPPALGGLASLRQARDMERRLRLALRRFRGVATKYLPNYLRWFVLYDEFEDPGDRFLRRTLAAV